MVTRVLVTRPQREALRWVAQFQAHGCAAEALPLIAIVPEEAAPLVAAWRRLDEYLALMFVSANAAEAFFAARPDGAAWPQGLRAWSTGPGTTRALRVAGVDAARLDAPPDDAPQFDSEALWDLVGGTALAGARVLIVRGADASGQIAGRPWLAERLQAAGCQVDAVAAYRRTVPTWDAPQLARARAAAQDDQALWLLSSSEAVRHLAQLLPGQDWHAARALATHARIAEAARGLGFGRVAVSRPGMDDMLASIESCR